VGTPHYTVSYEQHTRIMSYFISLLVLTMSLLKLNLNLILQFLSRYFKLTFPKRISIKVYVCIICLPNPSHIHNALWPPG
jgi:hypothetical protein